MGRRLSRELLYRLRNDVSISGLISDVLGIPHKNSEGCFRFLCPICSEFNTGTNPSTNLARCFRCGRNFNPIDMVMAANECGFLEAVDFLKERLAGMPPARMSLRLAEEGREKLEGRGG